MNFGEFELKSYEQLKNNKNYQNWITDIEKNKVPNGESKEQFKNRVIKGFNNLIEHCIKNDIRDVAIVCHSGVISIIMSYLFKENKSFYDWLPTYGRGYAIFFKNKHKNYKQI